jgi:hypothetical protein
LSDAIFHFWRFSIVSNIAATGTPGLLFKPRMENIAPRVGVGHLKPATAIVVTAITITAPTAMEASLMVSPVMHALISYAWERRKPELPGFTGNWSRIRIFGCRR